jgi:alkanesulfonate monooxygenase SsuD/methylene tetrahydromethanopterin reductase-like flavin-dependent oxidoreductase (luciferase family)
MTALGTVFVPQLPPERLRDLARVADDAGLAELWLWEDCFWASGIASAAAVLAWTERLHVGVGLLPVPLRNVALAAMEVATLHRMFPHRVSIGVGHGVQDWMAQVGARVESPMTLLREHLTALRALLRGEQVSTDGPLRTARCGRPGLAAGGGTGGVRRGDRAALAAAVRRGCRRDHPHRRHVAGWGTAGPPACGRGT